MNKEMSVPKVIQAFDVELLSIIEIKNCIRLSYFIILFKNGLDYSDMNRLYRYNGYFIQMTKILKSDIQKSNHLSGSRLIPAQVYELCVLEGEYEESLIKTIPRGHERYAIIYDSNFYKMEDFIDYIKAFRDFYNLILLDVSEILYLDYIKDHNRLKNSIRQFYNLLRAFVKPGITNIVFTNFFYYTQTINGIFKPEMIQIHIYPSDVRPFWEAQFVTPSEWNDRKLIFHPFKEVSFLIQY